MNFPHNLNVSLILWINTKNRYIYVFGGYKTEGVYTRSHYKISRKNEKITNVTSEYIEMYDTELDNHCIYGSE